MELCKECEEALRSGGAVITGQSGDCTHVENERLNEVSK